MPRISYFLGIAIYMYYDDHNPPHFHAIYNEYAAMINIETQEVLGGELPQKVYQIVKEWTLLRQSELMEDWNLAIQHQQVKQIDPLV